MVGDLHDAPGTGPGNAIEGGKITVTGAFGGGICTTSTTLFNAAFRAGMIPLARQNHNEFITRYPPGLDATVWIVGKAKQTMSFRNDTEYPILITRTVTGNSSKRWLTFKIWSVPNDRKATVTNTVIQPGERAVHRTVKDPTKPVGYRFFNNEAVNGAKVWTTVTIYDHGKVHWQKRYFSNYPAVDGVTVVGTGTWPALRWRAWAKGAPSGSSARPDPHRSSSHLDCVDAAERARPRSRTSRTGGISMLGRIVRLAIVGWIASMIAATIAALSVKRSLTPTTDESADEIVAGAIFGPLAFHSTSRQFRGGQLEVLVRRRDARPARRRAGARRRDAQGPHGVRRWPDPRSPTWNVVTHVRGMGGIQDVRPAQGQKATDPELVIEGLVIAGGFVVTSQPMEDEASWREGMSGQTRMAGSTVIDAREPSLSVESDSAPTPQRPPS